MRVWLVGISENLPIRTGEQMQRMGLLADALLKEGHYVLWWAGAFDHFKKTWFFDRDTFVKINDRFEIFALKGIGYQKNISLSRFIDHRIIAYKFKRYAPKMPLPDIIVAASPSYDLAYQAVIFAKKNAIPAIVDIRDEWPELFLNFFPRKIRGIAKIFLYNEFRMFKEAVSNANALVSMMHRLLNYGLKYAGRAQGPNDRVFYLGYNRTPPCREIPPKLSFLENLKNKFVVTFIGTFCHNNDPSILVECARELQGKEIHFVIAGDGELFPKIEAQSKGLKNLSLPGWLKSEEISTLLRYSHISVCPTPLPREAFPNKIFVYLSGGLPIISSFQGELREVIEKYQIGFYYHPNDKEELINCILKLYNDRELHRRFSENARKLFEEMFDAEKIYKEYANFIGQMATMHKTKI